MQLLKVMALAVTLSLVLMAPASGQVTLLSQGFESATFPPAGWDTATVTGTTAKWYGIGAGSNPANTPHSGSW